MQLKRNHKRNIVLGIAALFILYGLLDWIFKFNINPSTINNVTYVLMIGAFILLFSKPKNKNTHQTPTDNSIKNTTEETDIKNQIQGATDKNDRNSSAHNSITQLETKDTEQDNNSDNDNNNSNLSK